MVILKNTNCISKTLTINISVLDSGVLALSVVPLQIRIKELKMDT
jgi:hypothetical protein